MLMASEQSLFISLIEADLNPEVLSIQGQIRQEITSSLVWIHVKDLFSPLHQKKMLLDQDIHQE